MLRWLFIILLPLTLGWKLVASEQYQAKAHTAVVTAFLTRHNFDVSVSLQDLVGEEPVIQAELGECRLLVFKISYDGWTSQVIKNAAGSMDQLFFLVRGKVYSEQPTWITVTDHLWNRYLRQIGLSGTAPVAIAVAAKTSCNSVRLPWEELVDVS